MLSSLTACSRNVAVVAYLLAAVASTMAEANAALPAVVAVWMIFMGLLIRKQVLRGNRGTPL